MYLCLCNGLTDHQVREAAGCGHRTVGAVLRHKGVRPQCGKCLTYIHQTLAEEADRSSETGGGAS